MDNLSDLIIPFDYEHSGKQDYLLLYRPVKKVVWILKNTNGVFTPVYQSTNGIGGFNMDQLGDRIFAYDYSKSGKQDYLVIYRIGWNYVWIIKNNNGLFTPVYQSSNGIGGFVVNSNTDDLCLSFDLNSSGLKDHLVFNYSQSGSIGPYPDGSYYYYTQERTNFINNNSGSFQTILGVDFGWGGIESKYLGKPTHLIAYDFDHSGKEDYIVSYSPGLGNIVFSKVINGDINVVDSRLNTGIAGYNLDNTADRIIAFDYEHSGKMDYLLLYRPGKGAVWIVKHQGTSFVQVF